MPMITVTDQMGTSLNISYPPRRIVSLVPSQTELLHYLQLEDEVIGITKFCIRPDHWYRTRKHVGGTKQFDFDAIENIQPDLIIGNKEENYEEGIARLRMNFPVWMSDIYNLGDALQMMNAIGTITARLDPAVNLANRIAKYFATLKPRKARVLYLIWKKPWMAAGRNTFINDMLARNGFENVVLGERYPVLQEEELISLNPEYVFLSSEPFPFRESHAQEIERINLRTKALIVDGEMFSWYGSRLLHACDYFRDLAL
jgi:ABC-type Fe3+-hydroxamate transport system substrate-binding protein